MSRIIPAISTTQRQTLEQRIRRELFSWTSLALMLALLEGGVIGVLIKNGFEGRVESWLLNLAVAVSTGAPFYSNLISFVWVKLSHGRSRTRLVSNLALVCCVCGLGISQTTFDESGLFALLMFYIIARICWSGILTIRSDIWRANYPRYIRGKVTAKLATLTSLLMAIVAIAIGQVLDWQFEAFKWLYLSLSVLSMVGAFRYRYLVMRGSLKQIEREKSTASGLSVASIFRLLAENKPFAKYLLAMFTLGTGNLMFMAPLIVYLNEYTDLSKSSQILITTAIPLSLIPIAVGWWARLLDNNHIFHFRAIHSWGFVSSIALFLAAQLSGLSFLYFVGACCYGIAMSGAVIGWNLGHNDFVSQTKSMQYMAIHVTLTGVRGLFAPLVGIGFYQWLEVNELQMGRYALFLPLSITLTGAILFVVFNYQHNRSKE
ncbi:MFS transporter [Aliikangiella maris]|uniref:MFS transporter n=2 Tax=Aliikangiella maris TaxID=3162458 RepID=A0ABV3MK09_9GAMM